MKKKTTKQKTVLPKTLIKKSFSKKYKEKVKQIYENELKLNKNKRLALEKTKISLAKKENQINYKFDKKGNRYFTSQENGKRLKSKDVQKIVYKSILTKITLQKMKVEKKKYKENEFKKAIKDLKKQLKKNNITQIIKKFHYGT